MNFSFGSDPEFILIDKKGKFKSAIEIIKAPKKQKLKIGKNHFFYDNVLAECTVEPAKNSEEAIENARESIETYSKLVRPLKLTTVASAEFESDQLVHQAARESGCDRESCAYKLKEISPKKVQKFFKEGNLRTAGGHVHIGTNMGKSHEKCIMFVRMLDLFLGATSLLIDKSKGSAQRRELYGKPGRYRQPKHGVEYRTLGNFWFSSPFLISLIFDICKWVSDSTEDQIYKKFWSVDYQRLDSDEFWNNGGDPSDCHTCHGYDVNLLKKMFKMNSAEAKQYGRPIFGLIEEHMPKNILKRVEVATNSNFNMYKEWSIV